MNFINPQFPGSGALAVATGQSDLLPEPAGADGKSAREWSAILRQYSEPSTSRSVIELVTTILPFTLLWMGAWAAVHFEVWLALVPLWLFAGGLLMRLFLIQHDCGHGSFFRSKSANDRVGRFLGVLTFTPYDTWRHAHAMHHAGSGHLDHRGIGDIATLTVNEYASLNRWAKLQYRLYRHPLVLFGLGPAYQFLLRNRLPAGSLFGPWNAWRSTLVTNLVLALIIAVLIWLVGWKAFLLVQIPITLVAGTLGIWLFYIQHQFEDTVWEPDGKWDRREAALNGSSYYDLPGILRWFSANIGIHHVHHLSSGIPFYRLNKVLNDHSELKNVGRMTIRESFGCVKLALWDEDRQKLVSFKQAKASTQ